MRFSPLFLVLLAAMASAPALARAADPAEDEKLATLFRAYLARLFEQEPLTATRYGEHGQDHRLDDLSPEARAARVARDRESLEALSRSINHDNLSRDGQIDHDILKHHLEYALWLDQNFKPFEEDPRLWVGFATESVYLLFTQSSRPYEENLENAIARVKEIPRLLATARQTITNPPRVMVETALRQTEGAIDFYTQYPRSASSVFAIAGVPDTEVPRLEEGARDAAEALRAFRAFLADEVLPRSTDAWRIGPEKFARKIELELFAGLDAAQVLEEAQREAARVESEMAVTARFLWAELFPDEPVPPDDETGRRVLVRRVLDRIADDHSSAESVVDDIKATADEIKAFIRRRGILSLPDPDQCRIVEMPEFLRGNSTAYLNPAPPLDPRGSSEYAVSPPPAGWTDEQVESYFREYNDQMLRILTIHEAYPGHYVQLEYSNNCPSLIRKVLQAGVFAEGWAVYTEQMMLDAGYGAGDLKLRMQQLKFYLRAVLNAILDHEMHAGTMTDEQARALLMDRGYQTEGEALGKIIRAKQSSAQLSTYFVGRTAFYRLRQAIQREQGEAFDLGAFHEAALAHGTLPVVFLPELVRRSLSLPPQAATPRP